MVSETSLSFESDSYTVREGEEQNARILIREMHEGFSIAVTAKYNNSLGDDTLRANEQDLLDPMTYEVEASNQMFDVPLTDFFDDYIDEYTQEFLLEACYKETCTATFVFIEDDDSEYYGGFINPRCACAARVKLSCVCTVSVLSV